MKKIINRIIRGLGKKGYSIDDSLGSKDIIIILWAKFWCAVRGLLIKIWLKKSGGILFLGKGCKIKHAHKISMGRTVTIGDYVEINALSKNGVTIGSNVTILKNTIIECTGVIKEIGEGLTIGNNVGISQNCFIQVRGYVEIGSNVMFGPYVSIFSENHGYHDTNTPMIEQKTARIGVKLNDDIWIGSGAKILDGVILGKGCIVAAGAVVTKSFPEYSIIGGVPAKLLSTRRDTRINE
jgi:acetyltransferase-like isoleucine patch superfamily enzyme